MLFTFGPKAKTEKKSPLEGKGETLGARLNSDPWKCQHGLEKNVPHLPMSSEYLCIYLVSTCIAALNTCDGGNLTSQREISSQLCILHINEITIWVSCEYCWIARDVTSAMLVAKNKSISFFWELKVTPFSGKFVEKKFYCIDHQHGRLVAWLQTNN